MAYDTLTAVTDDLDDNLAEYSNEKKTAIEHVMSASAYAAYTRTQSMTGNVTLTDSDFPVQSFSPTAARDLTLPAVASTNHPFYVINRSGAYTITIKNSGGTIVYSLRDGQSIFLISDGANGWYKIVSEEDKLPAFHARQSSGAPTSIPSVTRGVVKCDVEDLDTGNYHDPSTGRFTPLVAGTYLISMAGALNGATAGKDVWIGIRKNGVDSSLRWVSLSVIATAGYGGGSGNINVYLNGSTDYVEFIIYNGDTASRNTYTTASSVVTWWQGHRISSSNIAGW